MNTDFKTTTQTMRNGIKLLRFLVLFMSITLASCRSGKEFIYLQDMKMGAKYPFENRPEAVVHRDDRLGITVSCRQPELAIPFNTQYSGLKVSADGDITIPEGSPETEGKGYRVDMEGNINFPLLGKLRVEGKSLSQVTELIKNRIIQGNYIKDPLVTVEFLNFKYTVLGAVGRNGIFKVDGDRVTLLEAIANAGDLAVNARVNRVAVIREVGNERQIFMHDLRSQDLFSSPCFYLQQNDIVYVEPKYRKKDAGDRAWQYITGILSLVTAVCSILWVTK